MHIYNDNIKLHSKAINRFQGGLDTVVRGALHSTVENGTDAGLAHHVGNLKKLSVLSECGFVVYTVPSNGTAASL